MKIFSIVVGIITIAKTLCATDVVINTIQVDEQPKMFAFSPDGSYAYTCNLDGNSISVINVASGSVTNTIPLAQSPAWLAISSDGSKVYVACNDNITGACSAVVISTATMAVTNTVTLTPNNFPTFIAVRPDSQKVYIANPDANSVTAIDATSLVPIDIPLIASPSMIAFSPDNVHAYVPNAGDVTVSVIDTTLPTPAVVNTITVGTTVHSNPNWITFAPNGVQQAYVANGGGASVGSGGENSVSILDTTGMGSEIITIMLQAVPPGKHIYLPMIVFSPDGSQAYIPSGGNLNTLSIIDTATMTLANTVLIGVSSVWAAVSPDSSTVVVAADTLVNFVNTATASVTQTLTLPNTIFFIAYTPNGSQIYADDYNLSVINVLGPFSLSPTAPSSLSVTKFVNNFGVVSERVNSLSWVGNDLLGYQIYRNGVLIATVGPGVLQYDDHNQKAKEAVTYTVISYDPYGQLSEPATITAN